MQAFLLQSIKPVTIAMPLLGLAMAEQVFVALLYPRA